MTGKSQEVSFVQEVSLVRLAYEQNKLRLGSGYALWLIGFHHAHLKKRGWQVLFIITWMFGIGVIRWLIQGLFVRSNINNYNKNLRVSYGLE